MDILAVIVLYKCPLGESESYRSLLHALEYAPDCARRTALLLYDNNPVSQETAQEAGLAIVGRNWYEHNPANGGVAAAYNRALDIAKEHNIPWLLLMDQDTGLPRDFLARSYLELSQYPDNESVAAIVPHVRCRNSEVSPKVVRVGWLRSLPGNHTGVCDFEITAINSGTMLRTAFMERLGGFDDAFWLDFLDIWLFSRIYDSGAKVAVSECEVAHHLSVAEPGYISEERYQNILRAESAFVRQYRSRLALYFYIARLLARSTKHLVLSRPWLARLTFSTLLDTISHS